MFSLGAIIVPGMDAVGKALTAVISAGEISLARFVLQIPMILLMICWRGEMGKLKQSGKNLAIHFSRGFVLCIATMSFFIGVVKIPLADALAIFLVEPLILTVISALLLREFIGWFKSMVVLIGMSGALMIIQPSFITLGWYSFMPLVAATFFAFYLLITRMFINRQSAFVLHFYTSIFASLVITVVMLLGSVFQWRHFQFSLPTVDELMLMFLLAFIGMVGHLLMTASFRYVQASTLAPLQYLEIFSATLIGYIVFSEVPSAWGWAGIALITLSGVLVLDGERVQRKKLKNLKLTSNDDR